MRLFLCVLFLSPAFAQTTTPPPSGPSGVSQSEPTVSQGKPPADAAGKSLDKSVIKPAPGTEAIKPKDYSDASGYLHPFFRMGNFILTDQKAAWTSPFHTSRREVKWWLIFGGATGALIASDKYVSRNAPTSKSLVTLGSDVSYLGDPYTLLPIAAFMYFGGTAHHSDHFRETGLLSFEALADATILQYATKSIFDRQRPLEGQGNGEFEASPGARYNSSFVSGHAIETFALASVLAHEYPHKRWVQVLAYSYAAAVVGARLAANKHFPGDVMAGGAIGWFVGDFVYGKRHNPALDKTPTITEKILDHLQIGMSPEPVPGD